MIRYLWTGKSEFCICGYHVRDHETLQWPVSFTERHAVICRGDNKSDIIQSCHCDEFRPYRLVGEDEEEVIEKQIREVIRK